MVMHVNTNNAMLKLSASGYVSGLALQTSTAPIGSRLFNYYCIARWLSHLSLQTHNLTVDFGHHRQVLFVLHFRDKDFALIELKSANILDI